ncbi:MAG: hypothetical protein IJO87_03005 [Eggerthellaceae bacterium]|nr:hypothetical protein [Eggerthellaceae bacterium]
MHDAVYSVFDRAVVETELKGDADLIAKFEVVTDSEEPIPGLYAIGTDGVMLYRNTYTILIPSSMCANNVNSGRKSIRNAMRYMGLNPQE